MAKTPGPCKTQAMRSFSLPRGVLIKSVNPEPSQLISCWFPGPSWGSPALAHRLSIKKLGAVQGHKREVEAVTKPLENLMTRRRAHCAPSSCSLPQPVSPACLAMSRAWGPP